MQLGRVRLFLTVIVLLSCRITWADMPPISDEDKKLNAVPGQPGAPAAVLYREEVYDDLRHAARIMERIKVLTEEGRKYADVSLRYNQRNFDLTAVGGRTVQPDGKVIPFEGKPFEKTLLKGKEFRYKAKTFTLPDVQPGSIIEYHYTLIYPDGMLYPPHWIIQDSLWQKQVSFRFYMWQKDVEVSHGQVARGVAYTSRTPKNLAPKQVTLPNQEIYFELKGDNIPPFIDEPYMPDSDQFKYNVRFYYRGDSDEKKYWENVMKYWNKDVEKFMSKRDGVAETVAKITSPTDSPDQKARKIYAFVLTLDNENYLPDRTTQEIKTLNVKTVTGVADVLSQKRGDASDITATFVALARAAGLKASVMQVCSRENNFYDPSFLDERQLDDSIAVVEIDGKDVFLDPGAKFSPYGILDWRHTMSAGYKQNGDKPVFVETPMPSYKDATVRRVANLVMKPDFTVQGPMRVDYTGFFATMRRQEASKTDEQGRKKLLEEEVKTWLPADAEVKLVGSPNWNDVEAGLAAEFQISVALASNAGKRVLLPSHAFHFMQKPMFPHADRVNGVYLYYPSRETDEITLGIPPTLQVESLPKPETVQFQYAIYMSQFKGSGNTITIMRDVAINQFVFAKEEYPTIKGFYDKVKVADEQQIIFRSTVNASAVGN